MTKTVLRMRLPRKPKHCIVPSKAWPTDQPLEARAPRYYAQPLPESDRFSIYDTDEIGEVCSCPSNRLEGILAALNGQSAREKVSTL